MPPSALATDTTRFLPGDYLLGKVIDRGVFATVHLGADPKGRKVAIKILSSDHPQAYKRFLREIKVMKALPDSPFVVKLLDDGTLGDNTPFIVMEYIDGFTLGRLFAAGRRLTEQAACELMIQLCRAFDGLHKLGVTHGDLKPNNIMLQRADMTVKLLDFGLVRDAQGLLKHFEDHDILEGHEFDEDLDYGMLMGTPEYMAPEQIADARITDRTRRKTDTPADVFGLGVLFFQVLTGRRPWPFEPTARSAEEYRLQAKAYLDARLDYDEGEMPGPPEIAPPLWSIIGKALRKNPKKRQCDARVLLDDIVRYVDTGAGVMGIDQPDTITAFLGTPSLLMELPKELLESSQDEAPRPPPIQSPSPRRYQGAVDPETQSLIAGGLLLLLAALALFYMI